jgi:hypothetical protein
VPLDSLLENADGQVITSSPEAAFSAAFFSETM